MRSHLVVVPAPSLAFSDRVVEAHEPVLVQAFRPELAVEGLDERVVRWFAGPAEVERDAVGVRPQIQVAGDELAALVDADRRRIAHPAAHPFEYLCDVRRPEVNRGTTAGENRLRIERARAMMLAPVSFDLVSGALVTHAVAVDLAPDARELDLELGRSFATYSSA